MSTSHRSAAITLSLSLLAPLAAQGAWSPSYDVPGSGCARVQALGVADAGYMGVYEAVPFWTDLGQSLGTSRRTPRLAGDGRLYPGTQARWRLSSAHENTLGVLAFGTSSLKVPLFGGILVPSPDATAVVLTDGIGTLSLELTWPGPLPGFQAWSQAWLLDPNGPQGFSASNAVLLRAP